MTEIEVGQYLRLDEQHATPATAKRSPRFFRRTQGLRALGLLGSKVLLAMPSGGEKTLPSLARTLIASASAQIGLPDQSHSL